MLKRTLVPLALVAALTAPTAASAASEWGPPLDPATSASRIAYDAAGAPTASASGEDSGGFDWFDAAVAFGLSATGGAVVLSWRRTRPSASPV